jgi:hypothetical protein
MAHGFRPHARRIRYSSRTRLTIACPRSHRIPSRSALDVRYFSKLIQVRLRTVDRLRSVLRSDELVFACNFFSVCRIRRGKAAFELSHPHWFLGCSKLGVQELAKSFSSAVLALSFFGWKQAQTLLGGISKDGRIDRTAAAMNVLRNTAIDQFGEDLRATYHAVDNLQRGLITLAFSALTPRWAASRYPDDRPSEAAERHASNSIMHASEVLE